MTPIPKTADNNLPENVKLDSTSSYRWEQLNETAFLTRFFEHLSEEMGKQFHTYNFFVMSSHDSQIVPASAQADLPNKVLFFISDESPSIPATLALQSRYHCVFKSYLPCELPNSNVFPFQLGYVKDVPHYEVKPATERRNDIFFFGNLNSNRFGLYHALNPLTRFLPEKLATRMVRRLNPKLRRFTIDKAIEWSNPHSMICFTDGFKKGVSPEKYACRLYDSKIALCPKGFKSAETFRHIEAMRAGTVLISTELPDTYFYKDSPIITASNWRLGLRKAKELLNNPAALAEIQTATIKWWEDICSERAAARYVRDKLDSVGHTLASR